MHPDGTDVYRLTTNSDPLNGFPPVHTGQYPA